MFTDIFHMFQIAKCRLFESRLTLMVNKHELVCEFTFISKVDTLKKPPPQQLQEKTFIEGAPADGQLGKEEEKGGRADRREQTYIIQANTLTTQRKRVDFS